MLCAISTRMLRLQRRISLLKISLRILASEVWRRCYVIVDVLSLQDRQVFLVLWPQVL